MHKTPTFARFGRGHCRHYIGPNNNNNNNNNNKKKKKRKEKKRKEKGRNLVSHYVDRKLIGLRQLNELQKLMRVKFQNKAIYERSVIVIIITSR